MLHFDREGTLAGGFVVEREVIGNPLREQARQTRFAERK
jgi:hypothetical protein